MPQKSSNSPLVEKNSITQIDIENIQTGKLNNPHFTVNFICMITAIYSGYLYWSSSEPGGQRWGNATGLPLFPIAPQIGGSITNAIFNYVSFTHLLIAITQPINRCSHGSTEFLLRFIHWISSLAIGISTTIPQWYIALNKKDAQPTLITSSAVLNVLVQTQGASLLLISSYSFLKKCSRREETDNNKILQHLEALKRNNPALTKIICKLKNNASPEQLNHLLLEDTQLENQIEIKTPRKSNQLKCIGYILAALGLWMNVPISIGTFVDTSKLTHSKSWGIVGTLLNGIANAGYYLDEFADLSNLLNSSSAHPHQNTSRCEMLLIFIIASCSLFSGFTVDQINWTAFENIFSEQWLWATSVMANLGAALYFNLIQSLKAPSMLLSQSLPQRQLKALKLVIDKVSNSLPERHEHKIGL